MTILYEDDKYRVVNPHYNEHPGHETEIYKLTKDSWGNNYWKLVLSVDNTKKGECTLRDIVYRLIKAKND